MMHSGKSHSEEKKQRASCEYFSRLFHFSFFPSETFTRHISIYFGFNIHFAHISEPNSLIVHFVCIHFRMRADFRLLQRPAACKLSSCLISFTIYVDVTLFRCFPSERIVFISAHVAPAIREEINDPFTRTASAHFQRLPPERLPPFLATNRSLALTFFDFHFNGSAER